MGSRRLTTAVALSFAAGVSLAWAVAPTAMEVTNVSVHLKEWEIVLSRPTVPVGTVVFAVVNDGEEPHDFSIAGKTTPPLRTKGSTATLTAEFTVPGKYSYVSSIDDFDRDMEGWLEVTGAALTTAPTKTDIVTPPAAAALPLRRVADVPLPGGSSRFDYQSFDPKRKRLFISHLGAGAVISFDVRRRRVAGTVGQVPGAHGVLAVPELGRVYATATDSHQLVAIRESGLKIAFRANAGSFPDGLAYAPIQRQIYVSDKSGDAEVVVDAIHGRSRGRIVLGGEAGNVKYDAVSHRMLVAVANREQLVAIAPGNRRVTARYALPGCSGAHGVQLDPPRRLAFVACERNARLLVVDLKRSRVTGTFAVGEAPDVLALDPGLRRLYVAAESGVVAVFTERGGTLRKLGQAFLADSAHSVAVDPATHLVYLPLEDVGGRPVLRIMSAARGR